ncbi:hypothetical protein Ahy_B08g089129 [Arachis hypogaea]|uniref:Knottins-like domain-containing protein n=1 Tax=Arachis hypogaea TaxID=3818 RepID=A0A444XXK5_ARAHY|nr:hypothetical protein Ahy_B08g089129 [Arachis hypogaea]
MERKPSSLGLFFLLIKWWCIQRQGCVSQRTTCSRVDAGVTSDHNCALVCRNEGFSGGRCHRFHRRCFCTKLC